MKKPSLLARLQLFKSDVEFKEIAILLALAFLFAIAVRLSAGHLLPADLKYLLSR
jgi:hypothetical protein